MPNGGAYGRIAQYGYRGERAGGAAGGIARGLAGGISQLGQERKQREQERKEKLKYMQGISAIQDPLKEALGIQGDFDFEDIGYEGVQAMLQSLGVTSKIGLQAAQTEQARAQAARAERVQQPWELRVRTMRDPVTGEIISLWQPTRERFERLDLEKKKGQPKPLTRRQAQKEHASLLGRNFGGSQIDPITIQDYVDQAYDQATGRPAAGAMINTGMENTLSAMNELSMMGFDRPHFLREWEVMIKEGDSWRSRKASELAEQITPEDLGKAVKDNRISPEGAERVRAFHTAVPPAAPGLRPTVAAATPAAGPRSLTAKDRDAIDWARRNPNDPRAHAILLKFVRTE